MSLQDRVMLLGYCRDMTREDRGFRALKETLTDNNHIDTHAEALWRNATYVDSHPWVNADIRDGSLADKGSYSLVLAMASLSRTRLLAPTFWVWVAGLLRPSGKFAAWIDDIHALDSYVGARHRLATVHRCAGARSLLQMSTVDQAAYAQALTDLVTDIIRWSGGLLTYVESEQLMLPDASRLSLCLGRSS